MREAANPTDTRTMPSSVPDSRKPVGSGHVCPFCGHVNEKPELACPQCGMDDTPGTRQATRSKVGPWYVLQQRNPAAPGMNFATLLGLIQKGRVTARSIVRGPTTHQLWRHAARVKGISREFSLCWGCGASIAQTAKLCPTCKRLQEPPMNADALLESPAEMRPLGSATPPPPSAAMPLAFPPQEVLPPVPQVLHLGEIAAGHMEMAASQLPRDRRAPKTSHRLAKGLFLGLLLLMAIASVAVYVSPSLWQRASNWFGTQWNNWSSSSSVSTPQLSAPTPAQLRPPAASPALPKVEVGPSPAASPVTDPLASGTKPKAEPASQEIKISPAAVLTIDQARDRARELRRLAFEAAGRKDYPQAVKCWEEMKRLPSQAWHNDLDENLAEARRLLQAQTSASNAN